MLMSRDNNSSSVAVVVAAAVALATLVAVRLISCETSMLMYSSQSNQHNIIRRIIIAIVTELCEWCRQSYLTVALDFRHPSSRQTVARHRIPKCEFQPSCSVTFPCCCYHPAGCA